VNIGQAWEELGYNPQDVFVSIKACPLSSRGQEAERLLGKARKEAKKLLAAYHPDRASGNQERFLLVSEALKIIESETVSLLESIKEILEEREKKREKNAVFIDIR
jgi:hypothetical protein